VTAHPEMRFSVDPWDPSYGTNLDASEGQSPHRVDVGIELPASGWRPLHAEPAARPTSATLFVDGVRRIDAQAWIHDPDGPDASPALYVSYAAGVMCCCPDDGAHLAAHRIRRGLVTTAAHAVDVHTSAGRYAATVVAPDPSRPPGQDLSLVVQGLLNTVEVEAAADARATLEMDDDLLVVDGPLRGRQNLPRTIGYVKTHHKAHLQPAENAVVAALGPGERTPVFRLVTSWERFTWYLRLPGTPGAPWAGIVRLECSPNLDVAAAVALARRSQVMLPRYASAGYKDSRAPQNLYPIAGLERCLRRRLGDQGVVYRGLRAAAGRPVDTAAAHLLDTAAAGRPMVLA
jgi:hypothetical protein